MKTLCKLTLMMLCVLAGICTATAKSTATSGDDIIGIYEVAFGKEVSKVEIYRCADGCYGGKIIWVENNVDEKGNPRRDEKNPDPELRKRRADQIVLIKNLKYDATAGQWNGGTIYNPMDGNTYDVLIEFENSGQLKVRGYIRKPMLGKTFYWKKLK